MKKLLILISCCGAFTALQAMKILQAMKTPELILWSEPLSEKDFKLFEAIVDGNSEDVRALLEEGTSLISIRGRGYTPIHLAAMYGNVKIIEILLESAKNRGVDIINITADNLDSPLHAAAGEGRVDVVKLLVGHGADKTLKDKFWRTARYLARDLYEGTKIPEYKRDPKYKEVMDVLSENNE